VCGSPRFEAHGLRFGGYRALTSLSAIASAVARAVQVPAHRAWHPPLPGNGRRCLQATRRRGVGRRCENGASNRWLHGRGSVGGGSEGAPATIRMDLEGERSPWKDRAGSRRKRRDQATDPTTEQGPEADATVQSPHELHPGNGMGRMWPTGRHANGKRATTAVTRNGCRRGTSFEGSESRCEDLAMAPGPPLPAVFRAVRARNAANLMTGSGMQQAREPPGGGSRRSGEKPQGRNRTFGVDLREPKRDGHVAREWTPGGCVGGEANGAPSGQLAGSRR
jgi:hypothetical protein